MRRHHPIPRCLMRWLPSLSLALAVTAATAQSGPPLRVILPVGPGSGGDTAIRAAQIALSKALDQTVVIENLPGAGGVIGTQALVRAEADGNTVGFVSNNHAVNPVIVEKLPYDSLADITPISIVGNTPFLLVVNPQQVPARDAKSLQAFLKASPGTYNYGSPGNGTILHFGTEIFANAAGVDISHIPYKGTGPMLNDLVAGRVQLAVVAVPAVLGHLQGGMLHAIGVTGKERVPSLPDVPTLAEQGFPEVDVEGWFAMVGPADLPQERVQRLHAGVVAAFNAPAVREAMVRQENLINPTTPEQAASFLKSEQERFGEVGRKIGMRAN